MYLVPNYDPIILKTKGLTKKRVLYKVAQHNKKQILGFIPASHDLPISKVI